MCIYRRARWMFIGDLDMLEKPTQEQIDDANKTRRAITRSSNKEAKQKRRAHLAKIETAKEQARVIRHGKKAALRANAYVQKIDKIRVEAIARKARIAELEQEAAGKELMSSTIPGSTSW